MSIASLSWRDRLAYYFFGPTILHLQHECFLLASLCLLTSSSLRAVYRETAFTMAGDFQFTALVTLWLSRHLFLRWICTRDVSTNRSPTLLGALAHWVTSYVMAGQYFDRPHPIILAKQSGSSFPHADSSRGSTYASQSLIIPSWTYTVQLFLVRCWYPLLQARDNLEYFVHRVIELAELPPYDQGNPNAYNTSNSTPASQTAPPSNNKSYFETHYPRLYRIYQRCCKLLASHGLPIPLMLPVIVMAWYLTQLLLLSSGSSSPASSTTYQQLLTVKLSTTFNTAAPPGDEIKPYGAYQRLERPPWSQVLIYISCWSTLASILFYGRIVLPIPDLVAGVNVLKAVRNEAKLFGLHHSTKAAKSRVAKENADAPWAEQYRSVTSENRLRLLWKLSVMRVMENLLVCILLARTFFICRVTGHCQDRSQLWDLSKVLFPAGISTPLRTDGVYRTYFDNIPTDWGSLIVTILSVVLITGLNLLAQTVLLDRSYLAMMGYVAGEWTLVEHLWSMSGGSSGSKTSTTNASTGGNASAVAGTPPPSQWDPRRRYKKGDMITLHHPGFPGPSVYRATSNSPEGRPFDFYLLAAHDFFRHELGHPATSYLIWLACQIEYAFLVLLVLMIGVYYWRGYPAGALVTTLWANLISTCGLATIGLTKTNELFNLAGEVAPR